MMPYISEGNRRSGVTLVMHHRLQWLSTYELKARHKSGDEHPTYAPRGVWHSLSYIYASCFGSMMWGKH